MVSFVSTAATRCSTLSLGKKRKLQQLGETFFCRDCPFEEHATANPLCDFIIARFGQKNIDELLRHCDSGESWDDENKNALIFVL